MTSTTDFSVFSARDAKMRFGELLDTALGHPVGITKHDRLTAYVVSKRDFEAMLANIEDLKDQLWLAKAELARKEGFVGADRVDAIMNQLEVADDEAGDHKGG